MKSIVICCDGTWNQPFVDGSYSTNVQIISEILKPKATDPTEPTIVYYNAGIGTGGNDLLYGRASSIEDGFFATTLPEHIKNAYKFLVDNYEHGDKIYLFGFSRGAFTVRSLASFIWYCGLLKKEGFNNNDIKKRYTDQDINMAYALYQEKALTKGTPATNSEIPPEQAHKEVPIEFLGVFDTVPALSEKNLKLHDSDLHPHIQKARHALAQDEHRKSFKPSLWEKVDKVDSVQRIFEGDHADIGGGWEFNHLVKLHKDGEPDDNYIRNNELSVYIKQDKQHTIHLWGKFWQGEAIKKLEIGKAKITELLSVNSQEAEELLDEWKQHLSSKDKIAPSTPLSDKLFFSYRISNVALTWMLKESGLIYFEAPQLTLPPRLPDNNYRTHSALFYYDMNDTYTGIVLLGIYKLKGSVNRVFNAKDLERPAGTSASTPADYTQYLEEEKKSQAEIEKALQENNDLLEQAALLDKIVHAFSQLLPKINEIGLTNQMKPHGKIVLANKNTLSFPEIKARILSDIETALKNYESLFHTLNQSNFTGTHLVKAEEARLMLLSLKPFVENYRKNIILRSIEKSGLYRKVDRTAESTAAPEPDARLISFPTTT